MPILRSGRLVDATRGVPTLVDIVTGLERLPRFVGQTGPVLWTVAHHITLGAALMALETPRRRLAWRLHDAHECVTGDIPSDVKTPDIREMQHLIDNRIYDDYFAQYGGWLGYHEDDYDVIRAMDRRCLAAEAEAFKVGLPHTRAATFGVAVPSDVAMVRRVARVYRTGDMLGCFNNLLSTGGAREIA